MADALAPKAIADEPACIAQRQPTLRMRPRRIRTRPFAGDNICRTMKLGT